MGIVVALLIGALAGCAPSKKQPETVASSEVEGSTALSDAVALYGDPLLNEDKHTAVILVLYGCMAKLHMDPEQYWAADNTRDDAALQECANLQTEFIATKVFGFGNPSDRPPEAYGKRMVDLALSFAIFYSDKAKAYQPNSIVEWARGQAKLVYGPD